MEQLSDETNLKSEAKVRSSNDTIRKKARAVKKLEEENMILYRMIIY